MLFNVYVQHENFEHKGKTHANVIHVGYMEAENELDALKRSKEALKDYHATALLMVEPVHNA